VNLPETPSRHPCSQRGDRLESRQPGELPISRRPPWKADRYNYTTIGTTPFTVRVQETYTYAGRDGAVSQRDTQTYVNGLAREGFTQGFNWRHLGNLHFLDYPECVHTWCATPEPRRVRFEFDPQNREYLASIQETTTGGTVLTDYATTFTYHPNGMPATVSHGNGVTDSWRPQGNDFSSPCGAGSRS